MRKQIKQVCAIMAIVLMMLTACSTHREQIQSDNSIDNVDKESEEKAGNQSAATEKSEEKAGSQSVVTEESEKKAGSQSAATEKSEEKIGSQSVVTEESEKKTGSQSATTEKSKEKAGSQSIVAEESKGQTASQTVATETAETTPPSTLQLVMVGDVLLHTPVLESGRLDDGTYQYDHLFRHVKKQTEEADIAIVNQEVILGGIGLGLSGYPCFNGPFEVADALADSGFDVILHATNHALDKGEKGVRNCIAYWKDKYPKIQVAGINESQEIQDNQIVIVERNEIKVAILNYTYGTNGISMPSSAPYLVNLLDKEKISVDVTKAKEMADFVVVCPHWGTEYQHEPDHNQKKWVAYFADLGVDLVIGTHPHVIEPVEWVEGTTGHKTLVYYSLGNFVNATSGQGAGVADRMLGAMADVKLIRNEDGSVTIDSFETHPLISHLETGVQKITVYPMEEYTPELEAKNEIVQQDSAFSIDYLEDIWKNVMRQ